MATPAFHATQQGEMREEAAITLAAIVKLPATFSPAVPLAHCANHRLGTHFPRGVANTSMAACSSSFSSRLAPCSSRPRALQPAQRRAGGRRRGSAPVVAALDSMTVTAVSQQAVAFGE